MEKKDILEKCREYNGSNDYLYYRLYREQTDTRAIVCAPCNYLYTNDEDQFFGVCIYMSENNLGDGMRPFFPNVRELFGTRMVKVTERTDSLGTRSLDNQEIRELPFRNRIDAEPRFQSSFIPAYTCFECADVTDILDPRTSLADLCRRNGEFHSFINALAERFRVETDRIGLVGSAALGAETPNDYDIVFYGDTAELWRINGIMAEINRKQGTPKVGGLPLPFRILFEGRIIDTLKVYDSPASAGVHAARLVRPDVPFRCRVTDDTAALQVEPYLQVDGEDYSSMILAETFFQCVLRKGDVIEGRGDIIVWEHGGKEERTMLCREPFRQLRDFTRYFHRYE